MNKSKISKNNLIKYIVLLYFLLLLGFYQYFYKARTSDIDILIDEINTLNQEVKVLEDQMEEKESFVEQTQEKKEAIEGIIDLYGDGNTIENNILFYSDLEKNHQVDISTIQMISDIELLGIPSEVYSYLYGSSRVNKGNSKEEGVLLSDISAYQTSTSIAFTTSYGNLKRMLTSINNYEDKRNIDDIAIVYDIETGNLKASMTVNMYHMLGTKEKYEDPILPKSTIGMDNIFRTIELP